MCKIALHKHKSQMSPQIPPASRPSVWDSLPFNSQTLSHGQICNFHILLNLSAPIWPRSPRTVLSILDIMVIMSFLTVCAVQTQFQTSRCFHTFFVTKLPFSFSSHSHTLYNILQQIQLGLKGIKVLTQRSFSTLHRKSKVGGGFGILCLLYTLLN